MNSSVSLKSFPHVEGEFHTGDVLDLLRAAAANKYQLIISSPPYNIGKSYEKDGKRSLDEYIAWQSEVARLAVNTLDVNGSLCWQVGTHVKNGELFPLDVLFVPIFRSLGLKLRNRIIWRYNFGLNADRRFSGRYETVLWFTKSDKYRFNLDPIRVPQLYPGKRHASRRGEAKAGLPSGNPLGKNPSDYWEFSAERDFITNPVWDIPNVKANHPEKTSHPCQFPIELAERCVLALTDVGQSVLDPFVGTGASVLAAVKHGRKGVGFDREASFLAIAEERMRALSQGTLPMRQLGKQVRRPRTTERVAQVPSEWGVDRAPDVSR